MALWGNSDAVGVNSSTSRVSLAYTDNGYTNTNNAGIGYSSFVTEIDKDIAQEVFQVNFFSIVEINKLFLPSMIKKNKDQ